MRCLFFFLTAATFVFDVYHALRFFLSYVVLTSVALFFWFLFSVVACTRYILTPSPEVRGFNPSPGEGGIYVMSEPG